MVGSIQSLDMVAQSLSSDAYLAAGLDDPSGVPDQLKAHLAELQRDACGGLEDVDLAHSKLQLDREGLGGVPEGVRGLRRRGLDLRRRARSPTRLPRATSSTRSRRRATSSTRRSARPSTA